jgi:WhiB family redox-sensing transcriptional regulator
MSLSAPTPDTDWMARAACRGRTDLFFPPTGGFPGPEAKAVCGGCPVLRECAAYVEAERPEGFWAGRWRHGGRA